MPILEYSNTVYPYLLKEIYHPPKLLYYVGDIDLLKRRCITIIGTRSITQYGKYIVKYLLDEGIKDLDIAIVSGMALGVDALVHRTCLDLGIKTVAIVPGSMSSSIPKRNEEIFNNIFKNDLVLAEFPEGKKLGKEMYVLRNRLLAGISDTTVVIEAGEKSGSLITARYALENNRDLYALPGNINSEMSKGCNLLLKDGASPILCKEDFLEILGLQNNQVLLNIN